MDKAHKLAQSALHALLSLATAGLVGVSEPALAAHHKAHHKTTPEQSTKETETDKVDPKATDKTSAKSSCRPEKNMEKCFGVNKAGKNDCQTATRACAGTAKQNQEGDAYIMLPKGVCGKLSGGSTVPKR